MSVFFFLFFFFSFAVIIVVVAAVSVLVFHLSYLHMLVCMPLPCHFTYESAELKRRDGKWSVPLIMYAWPKKNLLVQAVPMNRVAPYVFTLLLYAAFTSWD